MALNLKDSLEIVKRAGFGADDRMKPGRSERRMADSQRVFDQEPLADTERTDPVRTTDADSLDEVFERIDHHRDPQNMTFDQLLQIDDL